MKRCWVGWTKADFGFTAIYIIPAQASPLIPGTGDTNLLLKWCFAPLVLTRSCCQKIVRSIVQSLNLELILTVLVKIVQPPWKYRCILPEKKTIISRFPARFCSLLIFVGQTRMYHQPLVRAACAVAFSLVRLSGRCLVWKPQTDGLCSVNFIQPLWVDHVSTTAKIIYT